MALEVEACILDVDVPRLRRRLERLGAFNYESALLREQLYLPVDGPGYIIIRDTGLRVLVKHKQVMGELTRQESEFLAEDFDAVLTFFDALGCRRAEYREKFRTSYELNEADISLDQYPGIPMLAEVEASDPAAVEAMCVTLGLDFGARRLDNNIEALYTHYGLKIDRGGLRFTEQQRRALLARPH